MLRNNNCESIIQPIQHSTLTASNSNHAFSTASSPKKTTPASSIQRRTSPKKPARHLDPDLAVGGLTNRNLPMWFPFKSPNLACRSIDKSNDVEQYQIREFHRRLFPVRYPDLFYERLFRSDDDDDDDHDDPNKKSIAKGSSWGDSCMTCRGFVVLDTSSNRRNDMIGIITARAQLHPIQLTSPTLHPPSPSSTTTSHRTGYIMTLGVTPTYQTQGIGTYLTRLMVGVLMDQFGCGRVELDVLVSNRYARRLYEKMGFVNAGLMRDYYEFGGEKHDAVHMVFHPRAGGGGDGGDGSKP